MQRITKRGWISIFLMSLTLSVGTTKELLLRRDTLTSTKRLEQALIDSQKLRAQVAQTQEALTDEIRLAARGPTRTVTYLTAAMDGTAKQRFSVSPKALRVGDRIYYKSNCQPPAEVIVADLMGTGPYVDSVLSFGVDDEKQYRLGLGAGQIDLDRPLPHKKGSYVFLWNPFKLSACSIDLFVNSSDPLRETVNTQLK